MLVDYAFCSIYLDIRMCPPPPPRLALIECPNSIPWKLKQPCFGSARSCLIVAPYLQLRCVQTNVVATARELWCARKAIGNSSAWRSVMYVRAGYAPLQDNRFRCLGVESRANFQVFSRSHHKILTFKGIYKYIRRYINISVLMGFNMIQLVWKLIVRASCVQRNIDNVQCYGKMKTG
jgi:hypothetical protein